jgi:L-lactate dehydrogenase complex protein LldG
MVTSVLEEEFSGQARAVGAEIETFSGLADAFAFILRFLKQQDIKSIAVSPDVPPSSTQTDGWPFLEARNRIDYLAAGAGLVLANYGVSSTGTLVHLDRDEEEKIVWTLPPICLCLLDKHRIVRNLEDLAEIFSRHLSRPASAAPQVSLVTGPSRTADIECQLSLGVHGPRRVIILLYEGKTP